MDSVFQEEKEQLNRIEKRIDDIVQRHGARASKLREEIDGFYVADYDDRDVLQSLKFEWKRENEYAEEYRAFKPSPYFGRLDLELDADEGEKDATQTYYIGKTGIHDGLDNIVLDWRSPIGEFFYVKTERKFKHGEFVYNLLLRRALDVQKEQLISYNTEYDSSNVTLEGDVIDPFLLTVLKDKRRQNRLTDIIRTIQGNQNEIIRKPRNESFIVQGCAGSGKTMILLHRLSYLAFNNRSMAYDQVKILTPNKFFDIHIDDLSRELGLHSIERLTVEEFYVSLINSLAKKLDVSPVVTTEKGMDEGLLSVVYSTNFQDQIITHYNAYWEDILNELTDISLFSVLEKMGISCRVPTDYFYESQLALSTNINKAIGDYQRRQERISEYGNSLNTLREEHKKISGEYEHYISMLDQQKISIKEVLTEELNARSEELRVLQVEVKREGEILKEKETEIRSIRGALQNYEHLRDQYREYVPSVLTYDVIQSFPSEIMDYLVKRLSIRMENVRTVSRDYQNVPMFNFSKKNKLKKVLDNEIHGYVNETAKVLKEYIQEIEEQIGSLENRLNLAQSEYESLSATSKPQHLKQVSELISCIRKALACFKDEIYPNFEVNLLPAEYTTLYTVLSKYQEYYKLWKPIARRKETVESSLANASKEYTRLQSENILTEPEIKVLSSAQQLVQQLSFNSLYRNVVLKDLRVQYKEHKEPYTKVNYRHKIFLKLLFCSLYYKKSTSSISFLNIDEAQDLSVSEYQLLRRILGDRCVFNLYGDVNQLVYSYKGITDWEEIAAVVSSNVYFLNENYRNTLQITKYCNNEFGAQVYPIGINGKDVRDIPLETAVEMILAYHREHPRGRVAIIHRSGIESIRNTLHNMLDQENVSWDEINDSKISILSVELAKGIEFEAVLAIVDHMTANEKYISFTRALDDLFVVRDEFAPNPQKEICPDDFSEDLESNNDEMHPIETELNDETTNISLGDNNTEKEIITEPETQLTPTTITSEEHEVVRRIESIIKDTISENCSIDAKQIELIISLFNGQAVMCNAPSGWMKSVIFYAMVAFSREKEDSQSIIISQPHLQENILVIAEKMQLKVGVIDHSIDDFSHDVKRYKYDLIFVPANFFENSKNANDFVNYFSKRIKYIATDHLDMSGLAAPTIISCCKSIDATMLVMSKCQSDYVDDSFHVINVCSEQSFDYLNKIHLMSEEQKMQWLLDNLSVLSGQGLIYCDTVETCRKISKALRKKKINAPEYSGELRSEQINFLTNSFTRGTLPILVSTQEIGTNLSNAYVRFVIHYDVPTDSELYNLHLSQIGSLADDPQAFDLIVM